MKSFLKFNKYLSKQSDKLLFAALLFGVLAIGFGDKQSFLRFDLSADTKVSSLILWFTAIVLIRYTIETYDLRLATEKEVRIQEEIMRNEFLPILAPIDEGAIVQDSSFRLTVVNVGKGIARDVELQVKGLVLAKGYTVKADGNEFPINGEDPRITSITQNPRPPAVMDAAILYKDIYGRHFRTTGLKFNLDQNDPKTRYTLSTTQWAYKKI
jgi:hypothetical protein